MRTSNIYPRKIPGSVIAGSVSYFKTLKQFFKNWVNLHSAIDSRRTALFIWTCFVASMSLHSLFILLHFPETITLQTSGLVLGADNQWLLFLIVTYKLQSPV